MKSLILLFITLVSLCFPTVHAGNRFWEPANRLTNATTIDWVHVNPLLHHVSIWPDKLIPVCYESEDTRKSLEKYFKSAMDLWYAAGLPKEYRVRTASEMYCRYNRGSSLGVQFKEGEMGSTMGMVPPHPGFPGPVMAVHLTEHALGNPQSDIAHELGHVWGLWHEHQNKAFWGWYVDTQLFIFNCANLEDFEDKTQGLSHEEIWGMAGICSSRTAAINAGFGATEFLPSLDTVSRFNPPAHDDDVDWDSLMIYPSFSFAKGPDDPVLLRRNGAQIIPPTQVPTSQDVDGIRHLYENGRLTYPRYVLLNNPSNPYWSRFKYYAPGC